MSLRCGRGFGDYLVMATVYGDCEDSATGANATNPSILPLIVRECINPPAAVAYVLAGVGHDLFPAVYVYATQEMVAHPPILLRAGAAKPYANFDLGAGNLSHRRHPSLASLATVNFVNVTWLAVEVTAVLWKPAG